LRSEGFVKARSVLKAKAARPERADKRKPKAGAC
jgi:hypothetical protein